MPSKTQKCFYNSQEEAAKHKEKACQTNLRYSNFNQTHFTAGDQNQFYNNIPYTQSLGLEKLSFADNMFLNFERPVPFLWEKYKNITSTSVFNTFRYMFNKFKKGIFISIKDNKLETFLPFSNVNFKNEWSHFADFTIEDMIKLVEQINIKEGRKRAARINKHINQWYNNNTLVRYEYPIKEGDSGTHQIFDMFDELCKHRKLPDVIFFVNKRDFPLLKINETESYSDLFSSRVECPLLSHNYTSYCPILSMCTTQNHADIGIPTWEDWTRVESHESNKFFPKPNQSYKYNFEKTWKNKKSVAIFRGSSTGCGTTIATNPRLKLAMLSHTINDKNIIDAGITSWNLRPRLYNKDNKLYVNTIDIDNLPFTLVEKMSPEEQSGYKFIINVDGHVTAYRLSLELSMNSVILLVESNYNIWYMPYLKPWVHFVPVKADMSDLIDNIKWCKEHDNDCRTIAQNAFEFYTKFLQKNGVLDYLQWIIINVAIISGKPLLYKQKDILTKINNSDVHINIANNFTLNSLNLPSAVTHNVFNTISKIISIAIKNKTIENLLQNSKIIRTTRSLKLEAISIQEHNNLLLCKTLTVNDSEKYDELCYSYNVGLELNKLSSTIYNFCMTLGIYNNTIILQNINGITFEQWLKSNDFNINEYYCILLQLSLALNMTYNLNGFTHNDLYPWNIILQILDKPIIIPYYYSGKIFTIKTHIIPIIIDFGKANIIIDNYYYRNNPHSIVLQDIISIIVSSTSILLTHNTIPKQAIGKFIKFFNFIGNSAYTKYKTFNSISSIKNFSHDAKKYNEMIFSDKGELKYHNIGTFTNFLILNFYDDIYLSAYKFIAPHVNIDKLILESTNTQIINKLTLFLGKTISFEPKFNILQYIKFFQNMFLSLQYIKSLAIPDGTNTIEQLYNNCIESLTLNYQKQYKNYKKNIVKIIDLDVPSCVILEYDITIENLTRIELLLQEYDFSIHKKIKQNKLIFNTFNNVYFFKEYEPFYMPVEISKHYKNIHLDNIDTQYLEMIKLRTSIKFLHKHIKKYMRDYLIHDQRPTYDYFFDTQLYEHASSISKIIYKHNLN